MGWQAGGRAGGLAGLALVRQMSSRANDRRLETDLHRLHAAPAAHTLPASCWATWAAGYHRWTLRACTPSCRPGGPGHPPCSSPTPSTHHQAGQKPDDSASEPNRKPALVN